MNPSALWRIFASFSSFFWFSGLQSPLTSFATASTYFQRQRSDKPTVRYLPVVKQQTDKVCCQAAEHRGFYC